MKRVYLYYEEPMYWQKHAPIPCLIPDIVVYQNRDRTEEMFRRPGFLLGKFPLQGLTTIDHLGNTYEIVWAENNG